MTMSIESNNSAGHGMAERTQAPRYVLASLLCSCGGLLFGIHGLIVSSIFIPAAVSSLFAGYLADKLDRPKGISIGALIFAIGAALEAAAVHIGILVVRRCIEYVGEGLYLGTLVVYICETSPPRVRGALTTGPQLLVTLGLTIGWLTLHGRRSEATAAEREKAEIKQTQGVTIEVVASASSDRHAPLVEHKYFDLFSKDVRTRTVLAVFLMGMQQLSGIDGVLYYAPLLFEQAGLASSDASFFASGVSATVIFAVTTPALIWADRWGRRHSTIYGGIGLAVTMFLIGGLYAGDAVHNSTSACRWVVISFTLSWAVGIEIYAAEIQPQRTRASATSLAHGSNWAANFLVALTIPILLSKSSFGAYYLFGGCTLITAFICALFMPESKGQSLDDIEDAFKSKSLSRTVLKAFRPITQTAQG
ncbi:putative MFS sugar transporter [Aspergillus vadensis CBS 113365]|uniref:General substrate transporter n=1 Tax=Aspergillus vadensis (strain CBS 113365 / IMI 142717 / IBT 24658) TaxID=1448311 RepID=A0A319AYI6_ASPVC|nr:general substrate transporter [Aspergillus vadensis CBS 113365]PYH65456.1 general substrate transporter [Aspergillus vadensis CBS 113365]